VIGQVGEDLLFELPPRASRNHSDIHDLEKMAEQRRHFLVEGRLALGKRPVEVEDDQSLHGRHLASGSARFLALTRRRTIAAALRPFAFVLHIAVDRQ